MHKAHHPRLPPLDMEDAESGLTLSALGGPQKWPEYHGDYILTEEEYGAAPCVQEQRGPLICATDGGWEVAYCEMADTQS